MVRLTERSDMTLDVYRGRNNTKTTVRNLSVILLYLEKIEVKDLTSQFMLIQ